MSGSSRHDSDRRARGILGPVRDFARKAADALRALFPPEDRAGLYFTVCVHLGVVIVCLLVGLGTALQSERGFLMDFSRYEEIERMQEEIERLQREIDFKESISRRLEEELGEAPQPRSVAVNRAALRDDRGTDAQQLYEDAARLQRELSGGYTAPEEYADPSVSSPSQDKPRQESASYSGPSVVSYYLEGRKASHLPIPAYRCMGAGEVSVIITVDPAGNVTNAKVDESASSSDACLRSFAIRAARLSKFSTSPGGPAKQSGNIVYSFVAQ